MFVRGWRENGLDRSGGRWRYFDAGVVVHTRLLRRADQPRALRTTLTLECSNLPWNT